MMNNSEFELTDNQGKELLALARATLENYFTGKKTVSDGVLKQCRGIFVTLYENNCLRGCVGDLRGLKPLIQLVPEITLEAALRDPRFEPVNSNELGRMKIEISVLSPLKRIKDWHKIKLGIHGVLIKKDNHEGTFLPQVGVEGNWKLEDFLKILCEQKACLEPDSFKTPNCEIYIYTAQIFKE